MTGDYPVVRGGRAELAAWLRGIADGCPHQDADPEDARIAAERMLAGADRVTVAGTAYCADD
jgi:hypothetical protein